MARYTMRTTFHTIGLCTDLCAVCDEEITSAKACGWIDEPGLCGYEYKCEHCGARLIEEED